MEMNAGAKQSVFYGGIIKYAVSLLSVFLILFPFTFRLVYASSGMMLQSMYTQLLRVKVTPFHTGSMLVLR